MSGQLTDRTTKAEVTTDIATSPQRPPLKHDHGTWRTGHELQRQHGPYLASIILCSAYGHHLHRYPLVEALSVPRHDFTPIANTVQIAHQTMSRVSNELVVELNASQMPQGIDQRRTMRLLHKPLYGFLANIHKALEVVTTDNLVSVLKLQDLDQFITATDDLVQ